MRTDRIDWETGEMEPNCHWWTVGEAEDYLGTEGFTVVGGPLAQIEVREVGPDHWEVAVNESAHTETIFTEQDEAGARDTKRWLRRLHAGEGE